MNVDDVQIVGATPGEIIERVDRALGTELRLIDGIPGVVWAGALPGYDTTTIRLWELEGEGDEPDCWTVTVEPRHPVNGQAVATVIFRAVTAGTDWVVSQHSDAFGLVAKRPPHRRRARFRWEPGLFLPVPKRDMAP